MKKVAKALTIYTPLIMIGIEAIIIGVMLFVQEVPDIILIAKFLISMAVETIWFLIGKCLTDDHMHNKFQNDLTEVNKNLYRFNNASIEVLQTYDDFYSKLTKCRLSSKSELLLTQLDPWPPSTYGDEGTRKSYFDNDVSYFKTHPNVNVYRIISIETKEKLQWVRELIESTKDLPNLYLAFVNIKNIVNSVPFPKMLSLQIVDGEEAFLLNPQYSYMPRAYKPCYYIKNGSVVQIYVDYYKKIWDVLCKSDDSGIIGKYGCLLKDGKDITNYDQKLNKIKMDRGWSD